MASCLVGVYWGARKESREECARRLAAFLQSIAEQSEGLSNWFKKASSKKMVAKPVSISHEAISALLKVNRRDIGGDVISELGFSFEAWTGPDKSMTASLSMQCGAFSKYVGNCLVLSFVENSELPENLEAILRSAVHAFDPDRGVVNLSESMHVEAEPRVLFEYKR